MIEIFRRSEFSEDKKGIGIWIYSGIREDMFFTKVDPHVHNPKRKKRFHIWINFLIWDIHISIPLKHVGWVYYGRDLEKRYENKAK